MAAVIYKICRAGEWAAAVANGVYVGSADDRRDGFIHFSTHQQAAATARRYFSQQSDLLLIGVDAAILGDALRWEPSRGGDLFPHLFGDLPTAAATSVVPLTLDADGVPIIPPHASMGII
jgi:uncharacterized protein (DUF952 family)